jgi:hypothetical protein
VASPQVDNNPLVLILTAVKARWTIRFKLWSKFPQDQDILLKAQFIE